ncbi:MAG TPA: tetratricopeptide repeat protein [Thermoanaerobaculia bacterium]|nr:tetratricopeptide repeat protein [Thermoanaerobaculia bacterium]
MTGYGTREVAQLIGLSPARVRSYVRAGLLSPMLDPRGHFRFSFPDLVFLRTAKGLIDARIPPRRIRRALSRLARELPDAERLADLRIGAEGGRIVAADGSSRWQPESGQTLFDFGPAPISDNVAPLEPPASDEECPEERLLAQEWYEQACELEPGAPAEARAAYERAIALDPDHAEARVNLGRLLHERGDAAGAEAQYRAALSARPGDATAAFNLGVALEDLGRLREALAAYEHALENDPADADAHFNAANLCERLHDAAAALRHWTRYRALTRGRD